MLEPLESEPFRTYVTVAAYTIVFGSHATIYLLSIVGLLLRPFWRRPVAFLYPWVLLSAKTPYNIAWTPFRPSRLLLIHALWLMNSVSLWVGITLVHVVGALNEVFPDIVGLEIVRQYGMRVSALTFFTALAVYAGVFALWSSWMWVRSLCRSLAHFRRMNSVENGEYIDDAWYYMAPFKRTTAWAFASLPIYIGFIVVVIFLAPPFQG